MNDDETTNVLTMLIGQVADLQYRIDSLHQELCEAKVNCVRLEATESHRHAILIEPLRQMLGLQEGFLYANAIARVEELLRKEQAFENLGKLKKEHK